MAPFGRESVVGVIGAPLGRFAGGGVGGGGGGSGVAVVFADD